MIFKLQDYDKPTIFLQESGYLIPIFGQDENTINEIEQFRDENGISFLPPRYAPYFPEADIVSKINGNADGYFDFNKAIIDIGAHVGCYSLRTAFKYVYAFEPNKYIYHVLCVNLIMHNKFDNSCVYNVLLSDYKENKVLYDGYHTKLTDQNSDKIYNDIKPTIFNTRYNETMLSHILDEFDCNNVGLIKIDVEGMEEKVLRGGLGTIVKNNYPPILFELWNIGEFDMTQEKHDSLINFLENLGYEILWNWGDHWTHLAVHKNL